MVRSYSVDSSDAVCLPALQVCAQLWRASIMNTTQGFALLPLPLHHFQLSTEREASVSQKTLHYIVIHQVAVLHLSK